MSWSVWTGHGNPKSVISKSRDLTILTTVALFGNLREHEIEINRLSENEKGDNKVKGIALKSLVLKSEGE